MRIWWKYTNENSISALYIYIYCEEWNNHFSGLKPKKQLGHKKDLGLAYVSWKELGHEKRITRSSQVSRKNEWRKRLVLVEMIRCHFTQGTRRGWSTCDYRKNPRTMGRFRNMQEGWRSLPPHQWWGSYLTFAALNASETTWTLVATPRSQSSRIRGRKNPIKWRKISLRFW